MAYATVRSPNSALPSANNQNWLCLALNWVCFLWLGRPAFYHNLLSEKTLRYFAPFKIGFVFSNSHPGKTPDLLITIDYLLLA